MTCGASLRPNTHTGEPTERLNGLEAMTKRRRLTSGPQRTRGRRQPSREARPNVAWDDTYPVAGGEAPDDKITSSRPEGKLAVTQSSARRGLESRPRGGATGRREGGTVVLRTHVAPEQG